MPDIKDLLERIDSELSAADARIKKLQTQQVQLFQEREKRLEKFAQLAESLSEIWKPRLEALAQRFGDRVNVTPTIEPARREATFAFKSELAQIQLRFSAAPSADAARIVFSYDLRVMPILMQFESHAELEQPLEAVDRDALAQWMDDRIVGFVRTYLSLHENEYYLKDHMVEDPVTRVRFPKFAAGATLERGGKTYYFIGEETLREFEKAEKAQGQPASQAPGKQPVLAGGARS
jgi:YHS domain-containing protein